MYQSIISVITIIDTPKTHVTINNVSTDTYVLGVSIIMITDIID
jgi:hypothetical protein